MGNENTNDTEFISFESIRKLIEIEDSNLFLFYLKQVANDLSNRSANGKNKYINKLNFFEYMKIPFFVASKLYNSFITNKEEDELSEDDFVNGLFKLYLGNFQETAKIIFNLLDYDKKNKINKEDVKLMLNHLLFKNCQSNEDMLKRINYILSTTFSKLNNELRFNQFLEVILKKSSDIYLQFIYYFYHNKPFSLENINKIIGKYFESNINNIKPEKKQRKSFIQKLIKTSKNEKYVRKLSQRLKVRKSTIEINQMDVKNLMNKSTNHSKCLTAPHIKEKNKQQDDEHCISKKNLTKSTDKINTYGNYVYIIKDNDKIEKIYLSLINQHLYCYTDETKSNFIQIHNLSGCFIKENLLNNEIVKIKNEYYFSFEIIYLSQNKPLIFYSPNKSIIMNFSEEIKQSIGFQMLTDYYDIKETIGRGKFSIVNLGINKKTSEKVAIKIIKKSSLKSNEDKELLETEIYIMKFSNHPNIIKLYDNYENEKYIFLVMEYINGGNLTSYLNKKHFNISEKKFSIIMKQIGEGIKYLHENGIVHRDIKPENIMIYEKGNNINIKITDFGLSKIMSKNEKANEAFGTLFYVAPEILLKIPYGNKVDIWSLGVLLFYVLTGRFPFQDINEKGLGHKIILENNIFNNEEWNNRSIYVRDLIKKCLKKDPKDRIDINKFLKHDWFYKFN
jgi:hypothetical protein